MLATEYRDDLDGYLIGHGLMTSARDFPADKMCSFVWWFFTRESTHEESEKFKARLWRPAVGDTKPIPKESPWSAENEMKGFASLKAMTGA